MAEPGSSGGDEGAPAYDVPVGPSHARLEAAARQQQAVIELGMAALRGDSVGELSNLALRTLREIVGVRRAAIVREDRNAGDFVLDRVDPPDPAGERIVVRPGDRSQAGHTLGVAEPVVMTDRDTETRFDHWVGLSREQVRSSVTVVIPTSTGPFGVLGLYHNEAWSPSEDEVRFIQSMANVIGTAVDRRRTERALETSNARLRMAQEAGRMGAWEWDLRSDEIVTSGALEHLFGLASGAFDATRASFEQYVHPDDLDDLRERLAAATESREFEFEHRMLRAETGETRWVVTRGEVFRDDAGKAVRMVGITVDISERKRVEHERAALLEAERSARAAAERAQERLRVLADATAALSASLDYRETLQTLTQLLVPQYADLCVVDLDEGGRLRSVAVAHRSSDDEHLLWDLRRKFPAQSTRGGIARRAFETGEPVVLTHMDDALVRSLATNDEHLELLQRLDMSSGISVPLVGRGRVFGAISLVRMTGREPFDPAEDVAAISELARRAALAIDNARLFSEASRTGERFRRMAETLQSSLLPPDLPAIPGVELAATYRAAAVGTTVGGDFYDAFSLPERGWGLVVGDVQGKGTEAASLTAIARHTIRTAAIRHDAAASLQTLNDVLLASEQHAGRFCTVLYAELEAFDGGVRLQLASGGHPPALLRRAATATTEMVGGAGTLMGVMPNPELHVQTVSLYAGDLLVLYTDGVIEAGGPGEDFGEEGLVRTLTPEVDSAAAAVAALERAVTEFSGGRLRDDVAALAVRVIP